MTKTDDATKGAPTLSAFTTSLLEIGRPEPEAATKPRVPFRLFDLWAAVISIAVAGAVSYALAANGAEQRAEIVAATCSLVTLLALGALWAFHREYRRNFTIFVENIAAYQRVSHEKENLMDQLAAKNQIIDLHPESLLMRESSLRARYENVSFAFVRLEEPRSAFFSFVCAAMRDLVYDERLITSYNKLREQLCYTAAEAISHHKGFDEVVCGVNAKELLYARDGQRLMYDVVARSISRAQARMELDARRHEMDLARIDRNYLDENYFYHRIVYGREPFVNEPNLRKLLDSGAKGTFIDPVDAYLHVCDTCLIVPIMAADTQQYLQDMSVPEGVVVHRRDERLISGFLCVDYKYPTRDLAATDVPFFDDKFDLNIMRETAMELFNVQRLYNSVVVTLRSLTE